MENQTQIRKLKRLDDLNLFNWKDKIEIDNINLLLPEGTINLTRSILTRFTWSYRGKIGDNEFELVTPYVQGIIFSLMIKKGSSATTYSLKTFDYFDNEYEYLFMGAAIKKYIPTLMFASSLKRRCTL